MTKPLLHIPLLVGLLLVPALGWADFQAGEDAYDYEDYDIALKEWRPLAEQGYAEAQYYLGVMYEAGLGVPQDFVLGHMWMNLAAAQGEGRAIGARKKMEEKMTDTQLAEAQRLAKEWKPKHHGQAN